MSAQTVDETQSSLLQQEAAAVRHGVRGAKYCNGGLMAGQLTLAQGSALKAWTVIRCAGAGGDQEQQPADSGSRFHLFKSYAPKCPEA